MVIHVLQIISEKKDEERNILTPSEWCVITMIGHIRTEQIFQLL